MKVIVITAHRRYASLYFILGFADEVNESSNLAKRSHFLTGFSHGLQNPFAMLELIQFCVGEFGGGGCRSGLNMFMLAWEFFFNFNTVFNL